MEVRQRVQRAAEVIRKGGVVIFPTETVYALACSPYSKEAITRIKKIKLREKEKPLSVLCADYHQLSKTVIVSCFSKLIKQYIPGPVTFVLGAQSGVGFVKNLNPVCNTVGVRVPDHQISQKILNLAGSPIIATSVNISGEPAAVKISDISKEILREVDYVLEAGKSEIGIGSTVVDLTNQDDIKILRQGSVFINI